MIELEAREIKFDARTHKYTDEKDFEYKSVTQLIAEFTPQFDERYWLMYKALEKKHKVRPNPKYQLIIVDEVEYRLDDLYDDKYMVSAGMQSTCRDIRQQWKHTAKVATDKGHEEHNYLENCINNFFEVNSNEVDLTKISRSNQHSYRWKILSVKQLDESPLKCSHPDVYNRLVYFLKEGFTIYAEQRVYDSYHLIAGTIDVCIVKGKDFFIIDWKTYKDEVKFESGYYKKEWKGNQKVKTDIWITKDETLLSPLDNLPDCKGSLCIIQLGSYAYICEEWGMNCLGLELFHIRHDGTTASYDLPYRKLDIQMLFEARLQQLLSSSVETSSVSSKPKFGIK